MFKTNLKTLFRAIKTILAHQIIPKSTTLIYFYTILLHFKQIDNFNIQALFKYNIKLFIKSILTTIHFLAHF